MRADCPRKPCGPHCLMDRPEIERKLSTEYGCRPLLHDVTLRGVAKERGRQPYAAVHDKEVYTFQPSVRIPYETSRARSDFEKVRPCSSCLEALQGPLRQSAHILYSSPPNLPAQSYSR